MSDMKIIEKKFTPAGRELWLAEGEDSRRILLLPFPGGKDKVRVELLKRLRELTAASGALREDGLVTLQGVRSSGEMVLLEFEFLSGLWENWEKGFPELLHPEQAAGLLRRAFRVACLIEAEKPTEFPIHPTDLVNLGDDGIGFFDPRIGLALEDVEPVEPPRELCLPPEIIHGADWSAQSVLYTAGLSVYTKLAGSFPFGVGNLAEAAEAVIRETPLDIRCHRIEVAEHLARLLQTLLQKRPENRPDPERATLMLEQAEKMGLTADAEVQQAFRAKTEALRLQQQRIRQSRRIWQVGRWVALGVVAVGVMGYFLLQPGYHPRLNPKTPPGKVVDQFYDSVARLEVQPLQETLYKTGEGMVQLISYKFVISRYSPDIKPKQVLELKDLRIRPTGRDAKEYRYTAEYRLTLINGLGKDIQQHRDQLVLRRVDRIWKIVRYDSGILNERFIRDPKAPKDRVDKAWGLR